MKENVIAVEPGIHPSIVSVRPFLLLPFLWEEGTEETIRDGYVTRNPTA